MTSSFFYSKNEKIMSIGAGFLAVLIVVSVSMISTHTPVAWSQTGTSLIGYAWSDNIGWIDMNCLNSNTCGSNNFGLSVDAMGTLSGYAWSDNIGWISAQSADVAGCPVAPCTPTLTGNALSGWFRALAGGTAQSGGWDGYIHLSGITYSSSTNYFSGYGWGSTVVGWVDVSQMRKTCSVSYSCNASQITQTNSMCQTTTYGAPCGGASFCSPGSSICLYPQPSGTITVSPALVASGKTVTVTWSVTGVSTTTSPCTVTGNNGDSWSGASGTKTSRAITKQTTYTLTCTPLDPSISSYSRDALVAIAPDFVER